jgi:hypothetical protein
MSTHTPWGDLSPQIKAPFLERAKAAVAGLIVAEKPNEALVYWLRDGNTC